MKRSAKHVLPPYVPVVFFKTGVMCPQKQGLPPCAGKLACAQVQDWCLRTEAAQSTQEALAPCSDTATSPHTVDIPSPPPAPVIFPAAMLSEDFKQTQFPAKIPSIKSLGSGVYP